MGWPKLLVLVRHAESEGNVLSRNERVKMSTSSHAYKLTERGRKQAELTGEFLKEKFGTFDAYYVSYYTRSKETMAIIYPEAKTYEDPRLAEGQRGMWDTLTDEEMLKKFPEELERKKRDGLYHYRAPGGENWSDIELRIHSFLGTLSRDYEGQSVLMVIHGHWLTLFEKLVHHFSIEEAVSRYHKATKENASVTIYEGRTVDGRSRLVLTEENIVPWKGKI